MKLFDLPPAEQALFFVLILMAIVGLIVNLFLLLIIIKSKDLRQAEYSVFLINRCVADVAFSAHCLIIQPLGVLYWTTDPLYCSIAGGICNSLALIMLLIEAALASNRYVSICVRERYQRIYRKRNVFLLCALVWTLGVVLTVPHMVTGMLAKVPGYFCGVKLERSNLVMLAITDYPMFLFCYGVVLFCYCKIFVVLRKHQTQTNLVQTSRLQEDKSILRYIGASALLPLITESPMVLATTLRMLDPAFVPDYVMCLVSFVYLLCPVANPVLTLVMVRPIRMESIRVVKGCLETEHGTTTPVVPVTVVEPENRRTSRIMAAMTETAF